MVPITHGRLNDHVTCWMGCWSTEGLYIFGTSQVDIALVNVKGFAKDQMIRQGCHLFGTTWDLESDCFLMGGH